MRSNATRPKLSQAGRRAWRPELVEVTDLRRRQEENAVDWLLLRAHLLPKGDRELIEAVYRDGKSVAEIARMGSNSAGVVRTRVKQVVTRLCSDKLPFVVEQSSTWAPTRQRVAQHCVVRGESMREASERLGVSLHTVRRHLSAINELYHASLAERAAGRPSTLPGRR